MNVDVIQTPVTMRERHCPMTESLSGETGSKRQLQPVKARLIFVAISFAAAWLVFYLAYSAVILAPGYPDDITIKWYTAWIGESLKTSVVVCFIASVSLFFTHRVNSGNYVFLGLLCSFEFILKFLFFVAFFGV